MTFVSPEAASVMDCAKSISFGVEGEFDVTLTTQTDNIAILKHAVVISATPNARTAVSGQFQSQLISMITEQASYNGQRPLYLYGSKGDIIKATDITSANAKQVFWTLRGVSMANVTEAQLAPRESTAAGIRLLVSAANSPTQLALLIGSTRNKGYVLNHTTLYRAASTTFSTVGPSDFLGPITGRDMEVKKRYLYNVSIGIALDRPLALGLTQAELDGGKKAIKRCFEDKAVPDPIKSPRARKESAVDILDELGASPMVQEPQARQNDTFAI